jgi:tetratricopeptide (TPR) repeat protein
MTEASETVSRARKMLRHGRAAEACALLEPLADENAEPSLIRLLAQALAQAGDLNAALDRQLALVPPDVAQADEQGRADVLAAAQLAQLATDYGRAADLARELAERDPRDIEAAQLLSTLVLWSEGPEAARAALAGIAVDDAPPDLLAQMLAFDDSPPAVLIDRVRALAADDAVPAQERADLLLALAQHHDRAGRPDAAWETAERGNALAPPRATHGWRAILATHLRIARETPPAPPANGPGHFYLLGTPRSGQSLLQSILSAAPGVVSLGERGALLQHVLFRTGELAGMAPAARGAFFTQLAEADRRGIARLAPDARLVVDKSPLHLAVAGSVARIHPGAAFAAVVRDPADTALSIWLRSFPPVYDYANDFGAILDHLDFALDALAVWRD